MNVNNVNTEEKCIKKGIYGYPQLSGYLSVKQFMIIERRGKKYLVVRFANEADFIIKDAKFILKQLNSKGEVIDETKLDYLGLNVRAGEMRVPTERIALKKDCSDVVLKLVSLVGGRYEYRFKNDIVTVHYNKNGYGKKSIRSKGSSQLDVERRYSGGGKFYKRIAVFAFFLSVVAFVLSIWFGALIEEARLAQEIQIESADKSFDREPIVINPNNFEVYTEVHTLPIMKD